MFEELLPRGFLLLFTTGSSKQGIVETAPGLRPIVILSVVEFVGGAHKRKMPVLETATVATPAVAPLSPDSPPGKPGVKKSFHKSFHTKLWAAVADSREEEGKLGMRKETMPA